MKMEKKIRAILMTTLIATLSTFTASTYVLQQKNTYLVDSKVIMDEAKEISDSVNLANNENDIKPNADEQKIIADNTQAVKAVNKQNLSRGGSTLNIKKNEVKSNNKPKSKTTAKAAASTTSSTDERDLFARLVSAEAGGESFEGQLAVATVIMNRVKSPNYANSITGVILDKSWGYQFTPVADGRINQLASASAKKAVDMVLNGYRSFDSKVMFFLNPRKAESPYIINNKTYFKTIGNHDFYY